MESRLTGSETSAEAAGVLPKAADAARDPQRLIASGAVLLPLAIWGGAAGLAAGVR